MATRDDYRKFIITPDEAEAYHPPRHQETTNYRYLSQGQLGAQHVEVVLGNLRPGGGGDPHYHDGVEQVVFVLRGQGLSEIEGEQFEIGPGTLIFHPPDQMHRELAVSDDFQVLVIYAPPLGGLKDAASFKTR